MIISLKLFLSLIWIVIFTSIIARVMKQLNVHPKLIRICEFLTGMLIIVIGIVGIIVIWNI